MSELTGIAVDANVDVPMRDGVLLRADLYHPTAPAPWPVLLCRTPYNKGSDRHVRDALQMANRGYLVAVQDVRGRYASMLPTVSTNFEGLAQEGPPLA